MKPGESVTWANPGGGDGHNIRFEDESAARLSPSSSPWTVSRTFATQGAYPYYCEIHGRPGGGGMSGVVYVNATGDIPPVARLSVPPSAALVGQAVTFNGSSSSATGATITKYEWDLDGDGTFETDTGATPTASRSYSSPATLNVRLRVTDSRGLADVTTRPLKINAAPNASFTASPSLAQAGQAVGFDGGASSDSDGTISRYEWDLDGDGTFETDTGPTPTASRSYPSPATLSVKLRVTDSDGARAETTRSLEIDAAPSVAPAPQPTSDAQPSLRLPSPSPTPKPVPTPKPTSSTSNKKGKPGKCGKLKGKKRAACIRTSCPKLKGAKKKACVKKVTRKS